MPYLQERYARQMVGRLKTVEGRPLTGWAAQVKANDWITFKIPGSSGEQLVCRVTRVRCFATFEDMLRECGVDACLPGVHDVDEGVQIYKSFGTFTGETYAEAEAAFGAVAIDVVPLVA